LLSAGPFPVGSVATLAPGDSGQVSILLDPALPDGPWDARITLVSGLTSVTATARIAFPTARGASAAATVVAGAGLPPHSRTRTGLVVAAVLGAVALISLLSLLVWRLQRSRRAGSGHGPTVSSSPLPTTAARS
jgi:hypothetical protein